MTLQLWVVAGVVAGAVAYLVRVVWKTWAGKPGCGNGCGGCAKPTSEPAAPKGRLGLPLLVNPGSHAGGGSRPLQPPA